MKFLGLLPLSTLFLSPRPSLSVPQISPYVDAQGVFSQKPLLGMSGEGLVMECMDDAKKAILKGKENLEKWYHEGNEYIKQDELLCENRLFTEFHIR